jgi:hypothetical protein
MWLARHTFKYTPTDWQPVPKKLKFGPASSINARGASQRRLQLHRQDAKAERDAGDDGGWQMKRCIGCGVAVAKQELHYFRAAQDQKGQCGETGDHANPLPVFDTPSGVRREVLVSMFGLHWGGSHPGGY